MRIDISKFDRAFLAYKANPGALETKQNLLQAIYTVFLQACSEKSRKPSGDAVDANFNSFSKLINSSSQFTNNKVLDENQKKELKSLACMLIKELDLFLSHVAPDRSDINFFKNLNRFLDEKNKEALEKNLAFYKMLF